MAASKGAMQALIEMVDKAFTGLNVNPPVKLIEELAILVHDAMSVQSRSYHNLEHIFHFETKEPVLLLAAAFHDIVYYQVDKGFHPELEPLIISFIEEIDGEFYIRDNIGEEDVLFNILEDLFDFSPGEKLSITSGLNEFLSAVVMVELLKDILPAIDIIKIAICIETTIPFRGLDKFGRTHFEVLKQRLFEIKQKYCVNCTEDIIDEILKLAVLFSNQDVQTFADPSIANFIDITWKLLPETNVALRLRGSYTIKDYRKALQRMRDFLANLNSLDIFNQYMNIPPDNDYRSMQEQARHNIDTAVDYLSIKLVGMGILESLADFTGGDAPLSLFVGDIKKIDGITQQLNDFLPELPLPEHIDPENDDIYKLFKFGRFSDDTFDLKNSPLSLFIYTSLSRETIEQLDSKSRDLFAGKIDPETYLCFVPKHVLVATAEACASMALTRREKLLAIAAKFNN